MIRGLKGRLQLLLNRFGYEVTRLTPGHLHVDAFFDQKHLTTAQGQPVVFDVGANTGETAAQYRRHFPSAVIYSFEPTSGPFRALRDSIRDDRNRHAVPVAVSDRCGTRPLYLNAADFTNSLLPAVAEASLHVNPEWIRNVGRIDVETTTIDSFCESNGIRRVHILKMDIQGAELLALRGGKRLLEMRAIDLVYCEVAFTVLYEGQPLFCDLSHYLGEHGFRLFGLYDLKYGHSGILAWGDALFVGPSLTQ